MRRSALIAVAATLTTMTACQLPQTGDVERGESLYQRNCAQCHEAGGGIGSRLTPRGLASFGTGLGLLNYTRRYMPYNAEGTLPDQDYLDITAYLLVEHGFAPVEVALTEETGAEIALTLEYGRKREDS